MMGERRREVNGAPYCFFENNNKEDLLVQIHTATGNTEKHVGALIGSIDSKMDKLLDCLIEKSETKMIPVNVLGWIVTFLLVFNFALVFGLSATENLAKKIFMKEGVEANGR